MISACRSAGNKIVFCTFPFLSEKFSTSVLKNDPAIYKALQIQVEENNDIVREVCSQNGVPVVETASLKEEEYLFFDDCHMRVQGQAKRARLMYNSLTDIKNGILAEYNQGNK